VLNKIDNVPDDEIDQHCQVIVDELGWTGPVFQISALKNQGTRALMYAIMDFLEQQKAALKEEQHIQQQEFLRDPE
jgi:GTPase